MVTDQSEEVVTGESKEVVTGQSEEVTGESMEVVTGEAAKEASVCALELRRRAAGADEEAGRRAHCAAWLTVQQ